MINLLQAIILGIIQGITEWLPISSSAHLVILEHLFKIKEPLAFTAVLHFSSLIAILIIFRKSINNIISSLIELDLKSENSKMAFYILIGTMPILLSGYLLKDLFNKFFTNLFLVGIALTINGLILLISQLNLNNKKLNMKNTFIIGLTQALALIPGISRSGITISTGLLQGINKEKVATFSFLLAIIPIIGATFLNLKTIEITNYSLLIISSIITLIISLISLKFLLNIIKKAKFHYFGYYCLILGLIVIFLSM